MKTDQKLNMTMLCDFYELTMGNGYLKAGFQDRITYFDVYFRSVPDGGGYAIAAGLDQLIDYIEDLHFDQQDIDYLLLLQDKMNWTRRQLAEFVRKTVPQLEEDIPLTPDDTARLRFTVQTLLAGE